MSENVDNSFIVEMLRGIQASIVDMDKRLGIRMDALEVRLTNMERRQTASMHFEQSVLAHLTSIHESLDDLKADMRAVKMRLDVLEAA